MKLFHFSEEPTIQRFEPHVPQTQPEASPLVWAIDEMHASNYFFPRDCPRVCFWSGPQTTQADRERFFGPSTASTVIAVEFAWLERIRGARIYVYQMPPETFVPQDANAGYFVSDVAVVPSKVEPLGDPLQRLASAGVELRLMRSLRPLKEALIHSTVPFSMIRLRNAAPDPTMSERT
ncbi:MAG TPA: hypothetical protein VEO18_02540 [Thermoplasmata archaeon]|nr:hypothetical protein [Thermoplasmata archaeon]